MTTRTVDQVEAIALVGRYFHEAPVMSSDVRSSLPTTRSNEFSVGVGVEAMMLCARRGRLRPDRAENNTDPGPRVVEPAGWLPSFLPPKPQHAGQSQR